MFHLGRYNSREAIKKLLAKVMDYFITYPPPSPPTHIPIFFLSRKLSKAISLIYIIETDCRLEEKEDFFFYNYDDGGRVRKVLNRHVG